MSKKESYPFIGSGSTDWKALFLPIKVFGTLFTTWLGIVTLIVIVLAIVLEVHFVHVTQPVLLYWPVLVALPIAGSTYSKKQKDNHTAVPRKWRAICWLQGSTAQLPTKPKRGELQYDGQTLTWYEYNALLKVKEPGITISALHLKMQKLSDPIGLPRNADSMNILKNDRLPRFIKKFCLLNVRF